MSDIDDVVDQFVPIMRRKLIKRMARYGGTECWRGADVVQLIAHLRREVEEFEEAILNCADDAEVASEAADVANMAMIILDADRH